jgi:excisionase family DNA binding protein
LKVEKMSDDTKKVSWPASGGHVREGARKTTAITDFFTVGQVADLLEVSTRTVRRWISTELLVTHQIGGVVRIAEHDLRVFLAQHRAG